MQEVEILTNETKSYAFQRYHIAWCKFVQEAMQRKLVFDPSIF